MSRLRGTSEFKGNKLFEAVDAAFDNIDRSFEKMNDIEEAIEICDRYYTAGTDEEFRNQVMTLMNMWNDENDIINYNPDGITFETFEDWIDVSANNGYSMEDMLGECEKCDAKHLTEGLDGNVMRYIITLDIPTGDESLFGCSSSDILQAMRDILSQIEDQDVTGSSEVNGVHISYESDEMVNESTEYIPTEEPDEYNKKLDALILLLQVNWSAGDLRRHWVGTNLTTEQEFDEMLAKAEKIIVDGGHSHKDYKEETIEEVETLNEGKLSSELTKYFNEVTAEQLADVIGTDVEDVTAGDEEIIEAGIEIIGYAIAKDEFFDALSDDAISFGSIGADGKIYYSYGGNRVTDISLDEIEDAIERNMSESQQDKEEIVDYTPDCGEEPLDKE